MRIKPVAEILPTLNRKGQNRGLTFDPEMVPYCGGKYQVRGVVRRLIDEPTGRMLEMKNPCIALEGVVCNSEYSEKRFMCPRGILSYWRPIWLDEVNASAVTDPRTSDTRAEARPSAAEGDVWPAASRR